MAIGPLRLAPPIRPGDVIAIVAPSSPFDVDRYRRGEAWLRGRYRVRVRDDLFERAGFLAGDDVRREGELAAAIEDREVRAIVAARGGYGATRFAHRLDWGAFASSRKWLVGFSDVTALLVEAARAGSASIHGPMVASLGDLDEDGRERWAAVLEGEAPRPWSGLEVAVAGNAEGFAYGGNLAMLEACASAGRLRVPEGAIVMLEDCTERPYRVDRMLTSLLVGGHLANARAVVVGGFTDCPTGPDGVTVEAVLRERLATLGVPVLMGAPFGHGAQNRPFVIGGHARVVCEGGGGTVTFRR